MDTAIYGRVIDWHGDWLYYQGDFGELYKINLDGSQKQLLIEQGAYWVTVENDWIYYSNKADKFRLYKIKHDGSASTKLNNSISFNLYAHENFIWYTNIDDYKKVCKMNPETGAAECFNLQAGKFIVYEGWIFYRNKKLNNSISKAKVDGSQTVSLISDPVGDFIISGSRLYYINKKNGSTIYRLGINGGEPVQLCDEKAAYLNKISNWLFYCNSDDSNKIYALRELDSLKLKSYDSEATCLKGIGNRLFFSDVKKGKLISMFSKFKGDEYANDGIDNPKIVQEVTPLNHETLSNL
jgi:hypothetical protein